MDKTKSKTKSRTKNRTEIKAKSKMKHKTNDPDRSARDVKRPGSFETFRPFKTLYHIPDQTFLGEKYFLIMVPQLEQLTTTHSPTSSDANLSKMEAPQPGHT